MNAFKGEVVSDMIKIIHKSGECDDLCIIFIFKVVVICDEFD